MIELSFKIVPKRRAFGWYNDGRHQLQRWCAVNCQGSWCVQNKGIFAFELESDAVHFALKWA